MCGPYPNYNIKGNDKKNIFSIYKKNKKILYFSTPTFFFHPPLLRNNIIQSFTLEQKRFFFPSFLCERKKEYTGERYGDNESNTSCLFFRYVFNDDNITTTFIISHR